MEPCWTRDFESGEEPNHNCADTEKKNVKAAGSNELGEEEHETQENPDPPVHHVLPNVAEAGRNFKPAGPAFQINAVAAGETFS